MNDAKVKLLLFKIKNDLVRKRNCLIGTLPVQQVDKVRERIKNKIQLINKGIAEIDDALGL